MAKQPVRKPAPKVAKTPIKKSVKAKAPFKAKDTVHVKTSGGYNIVAKKGSNFAKGAVGGTVVNAFRPKSRVSGGEKTDPLAVKNYNKLYKKKK